MIGLRPAGLCPALIRISRIEAPGELPAKGLQKIVLIQPDQANGESLAANSELDLFIHDLLSRIQYANKILGPAFDLEGNDIIIRNYDRPDV